MSTILDLNGQLTRAIVNGREDDSSGIKSELGQVSAFTRSGVSKFNQTNM